MRVALVSTGLRRLDCRRYHRFLEPLLRARWTRLHHYTPLVSEEPHCRATEHMVGLSALIEDAGWTRFPPRLEWQPIVYPVMTEDHATTITRDWNVKWAT